jgi:hypothetical protein
MEGGTGGQGKSKSVNLSWNEFWYLQRMHMALKKDLREIAQISAVPFEPVTESVGKEGSSR